MTTIRETQGTTPKNVNTANAEDAIPVALPGFPIQRPRRLRRTPAIRDLVRETSVRRAGLVYPMFVCPGSGVRNEIASMPECAQLSVDQLLEDASAAFDDGVQSIILFGIPAKKDAVGSEGYAEDGIIPTAIRALKKKLPELVIWADVCLCEYTNHGHCGVLEEDPVAGATVDNDATVPLLAAEALAYARAGADVVAPSDMMDGRVGAIRHVLDAHDLVDTIIVSYAAKYASAFYGPFREAAESTPERGDRKSYQMDPGNSDEALREVALDLEEGADVVMVKPALPYLDVIRRVKETFNVPTAAYNVSGEYSMLCAAAERGWLDLDAVMWESLLSIHRAGADIILTYFARRAARALR